MIPHFFRCLGYCVLFLAVALPGCGGSSTGDPGNSVTPEIPRARTLPIPSSGAGEPRAGQPSVGTTGLIWDVPEHWVSETPSSSMRLAQYRVAGPAGDAVCAVFYFGPGQGGDPMSNANRWADQFTQPDGTPSQARMKVETVEGASVPVQLVEVRGTYHGMSNTIAPADPSPGSMLLGAIALGPDAPWFFKLTGPEATVEAQRTALRQLLLSLRPES